MRHYTIWMTILKVFKKLIMLSCTIIFSNQEINKLFQMIILIWKPIIITQSTKMLIKYKVII